MYRAHASKLTSEKSGQSSGDGGEVELIDLTGEALKKRASDSKRAAKKVKASTSLQLRGLAIAEVQRGIKDESLATKKNASGGRAVWEDFLRVVTVGTDEVLDFVACKNCTQVYTFSIKTGTTSLLHHSAKCKEKAAGSIQRYLKVGVTTEEKQLMSEALAKFCALDSQAFRVCEGKGFELMIDTVLEIAKKHKGAPFPARELLPSATTVSTSVTNQAKALRKISVLKLKKILRTRGVCISVDGWTEDYTKTKFVQFIIHYMEDCILKEELITISEFDATKSQTAAVCRLPLFKRSSATINSMQKMCGTTSLTAQPIAATTDAASSFTEFNQFCRYSYTGSAVNHADEITLFQSLPPPVSSKLIPEFWQEHAATLSKVYKLDVRVLAVPASSCSPERLFSDAGSVFTEKGTSLGSEKLDDLLYLKWNLVVEDSGKPKTSAKNSLPEDVKA
ncbi:hypothetical protein RvY_06418 [Ramazzottius varieornatus]|uniref:HAT C-terminal dimerisation domain-containing protein n=1 Tax=Ramazzottius varieornatus TaxID=947166 RepID=A0A1D1V782_RAMVA|nr:hypothetical protein RvY_06418 [Ramazzottius varieornatus]